MYTQFIPVIVIPIIAMLFQLPYNVRWTAKLLRRDVRNLRAKCTTRLKRRLRPDDVAGCTPAH
jgi:hypothetical protein